MRPARPSEEPFESREAAGRALARRLAPLRAERPLVLALPRGGVPVAAPVAEALDAPLDVVLVRKIGHPRAPEFAVGAVVEGVRPQLVRNEGVAEDTEVGEDYLAGRMAEELARIGRRRALYRGHRPMIDPAGRTVVVVDDGVATGATVRAALVGMREARPKRVVLAVPVASGEALARLAGAADAIECLRVPGTFTAVGQHYRAFDQVGDDEVVALLDAAARRMDAAPPGGRA